MHLTLLMILPEVCMAKDGSCREQATPLSTQSLSPVPPHLFFLLPVDASFSYASCCTSINEIVCHGIPDSTVLEDGMIVNVDVTVFYKGYHGDCSEMFLVGEVDQAGKDLVKVKKTFLGVARRAPMVGRKGRCGRVRHQIFSCLHFLSCSSLGFWFPFFVFVRREDSSGDVNS